MSDFFLGSARNLCYLASGGFIVHGVYYGNWGEGVTYLVLNVVMILGFVVVARLARDSYDY